MGVNGARLLTGDDDRMHIREICETKPISLKWFWFVAFIRKSKVVRCAQLCIECSLRSLG
jgi:hypothetical protein